MYATLSKYGNEVVAVTKGVYFSGPSHGAAAAPPPRRRTPEASFPEMQYENLGSAIWVTSEREPRFMPIRPVVLESSSTSEVYPVVSMHPNRVPGCDAPPMKKVSAARVPSTEEESA